MNSFLNHKRPLIVPLLDGKTPDELVREIGLCKAEGADAFGIQLERLPAESRTDEALKTILSAMEGYPSYIACYATGDALKEDDDARVGTILRALRLGGTLADIRMDLFRQTPYERTDDPEAVARQIELIRTIHAMGKEVVMSAHVRGEDGFRFLHKEEVIEWANEQARRGADIAKIVSKADTEDELKEAFETLALAAREVPIPTLFLVNGKLARRHRLGGALMAEPMVFAKEDSHATDASTQQPISNYRRVFTLAGYFDGNKD